MSGLRNVPRAEPALLHDLAAAYVNGMSVRALASQRGWSYGVTYNRLQAAVRQGLMVMRPRGTRSSNVNDR